MAYENIQFNYDNFCISPLVDTYASIDTTNTTATLQVRNSSGVVQKNFDISPTISQGTSVRSLEYIGPRSVTVYRDDMPFFTLEHDSSSQCTVKRWKLNNTFSRLDLDHTLTFNSNSTYYFDCNSMAVEHYRTSFLTATATGTGYIRISSTYRDHIEAGDKLYLGTSTNAFYTNAFEEVEVTSISGSYAYITASGIIPPFNQYNSGDVICFYKDIFLFSNVSVSGTNTKGALYRIDSNTGAVKDYHESASYINITGSAFGLPYNNTVGFVRNSNLLFVDIDDFEVKKSFALLNVKSDGSVITCRDLAFTNNTIYRLQSETLRRDDVGNLLSYTWSKYNYQTDAVITYSDSITMWSEPKGVLHNQETVTLKAMVRDQYGAALNNQTVTFAKVTGDTAGSFDPPSGQVLTNASGIATVEYTAGWSDPNVADNCCEDIIFSTVTDNSSTLTGSQYVWGRLLIWLKSKYIHTSYSKKIKQKIDSKSCDTHLKQLLSFSSELRVDCLSKFWNPGGDGDAYSGHGLIIKQLQNFDSDLWVKQLSNDFDSTTPIKQIVNKTDTMPLSQTYISRHLSSGHQDDITINQFRFLLDAIPAFYSEKNSVDTDIWLKVAPFGFDLDYTTLSFMVREVSYAGDTGYIEYAGTANIDVVTFDAGAGLLGLEITYTPSEPFHNSGIVYVLMSVYDKAVPPNKITLDYWFKILPDYKAPYITNESPARNQTNVPIDTNIEFDIIDLGVGVDISKLEVYVNNRFKPFTHNSITNGHHIVCDPASDFFYGQEVDITVRAWDASENKNALFDTYKFYCLSSTGPWIDAESFSPKICSKNISRYIGKVEFNVYALDDTGIKEDSIRLEIDNKSRQVSKVPIIYRIM